MDRVPILKLGDLLLVSIQIDLDDETALALQDDLSERIVATGAKGVLIDISAVEIVDSFIGRMLSTIASISRVLDAETVVVGMRPAVAITLVELGLSLGGVRTALDVEKGMRMLGADGRGRHGLRSRSTTMPPRPSSRDVRSRSPRRSRSTIARRPGRRAGAPGHARAGRRAPHCRSSTRPRSSPRRASSPATR